jgi:hypothetical protein
MACSSSGASQQRWQQCPRSWRKQQQQQQLFQQWWQLSYRQWQ